MLHLLIGTDWTANRHEVLTRLAGDVARRQPNRILMVPELISHETERALCAAAGDTASRYAEVLSFTRLARRAGILHDCTKYLELDEQLALCKKYHIPLDELERKALKLLHSKTGAAIARDVFAVDDDVYNAIMYHTTGKPDMTLLEKIIYLADYIEPTRDFPGVEALRRTVYEDLDRGLLMGLTMTIDEMEEMGNPVHHMTRDARDYLMKRGIS